MSHELTESAPLVRTALARLDRKNVMITTADDTPIVNGRLAVEWPMPRPAAIPVRTREGQPVNVS